MKPTRRLLLALFALFGVAIVATLEPGYEGAWLAGCAALLAAMTFDVLRSRRDCPWRAVRRLPPSLALGVWQAVEIVIEENEEGGRRRGPLVLADESAPRCLTRGLPRRIDAPEARFSVQYDVKPTERGVARFGLVRAWAPSRLGLFEMPLALAGPETVRVLPNFRPLLGYTLLAARNRLADIGIRSRRRRGQGSEFEQLRDYREDDSLRQIDWAASARFRRPISREYREETNQQVVFAIDCGRRTQVRVGDLTHLDHILNAVLLCSFAALRQGDAVGFATFGGVERSLDPQKGAGAMHRVVAALYDLPSTRAAADYREMAVRVASGLTRRSLVVVVTDLRDEDPDELVPAVRRLARRHLVVVASVRDHSLDSILATPAHDLPDALRVGATFRYLEFRSRLHRRLRAEGTATLDVAADRLAPALVNQYLALKRAQSL